MLTRNEAILAKIESSYGVDSVPTGVDAVALAGVVTANPNEGARFAERPLVRGGSIGKASPLYGGSLYSLQFTVELKGSGSAADVPPEFGPLLRACGCLETIVATTSVGYSPRSTGFESCTIHYYQDGIRTRLTGCRGTAVIRGTVGEVVQIEFNMIGRKTAGDPTDLATPSPTLDAATPATFLGSNFFSLDAYNPSFTEFTLDLQNTVGAPPNANAADGYGDVEITERDPRGTLDPLMTLVATQDWLDDLEQGATQSASLQLGTAGGNQYTLAVPRMRYIEQGFDEREGNRVITIGYKGDESTSLNDEFSLTFT